MKLSFNDLFKTTGDQLIAKRNIRIGALIIPLNHPISPDDPNLGIPIQTWRDKQFDVDMDQDVIVVKQIID